MIVYISYPMDTNAQLLNNVRNRLLSKGHQVIHWTVGRRYDPDLMTQADLIIYIPPDNKFEIGYSYISKGCLSEIKRAQDILKIPIRLAYVSKSSGILFYETEKQNGSLRGISGTSDDGSFINSEISTKILRNRAVCQAPDEFPLTPLGEINIKEIEKYLFKDDEDDDDFLLNSDKKEFWVSDPDRIPLSNRLKDRRIYLLL